MVLKKCVLIKYMLPFSCTILRTQWNQELARRMIKFIFSHKIGKPLIFQQNYYSIKKKTYLKNHSSLANVQDLTYQNTCKYITRIKGDTFYLKRTSMVSKRY